MPSSIAARRTLAACLAVACLAWGAVAASGTAVASAAVPAPAPNYGWASAGLTFASTQQLLPASAVAAGPSAPMSRAAYAQSLVLLDTWRSGRAAQPTLLSAVPTGATLGDVAPDSIYARAVAAGWLSPVNGSFAGSLPLTPEEAAKGAVGALGLRDSAVAFAAMLRRATPGLRTNFYYRAAQVYVRALGLRYNNLQGTEQLEVGPGEPMQVAHVAYLLQHAATLDPWQLDSVRSYEQFALPALGPLQKHVLYTGIQLIGQPYVWAGETEGTQPEGHGGFDCSGFVWRTELLSGLSLQQRVPVGGRSSMQMSGEQTRASRIYDMAKLRPGDVLFFGDKGRRSKPAANYHAAVYMGNGWFIHSSGGNDGVSIDKLDGWWGSQFSWARRVLRGA